MKTEYKWIRFKNIPVKTKTQYWECYNKEEETYLGYIKWYGGFHSYCWFQEPDMVMAKSCLLDIADFIKQLMDERR